MIAAEVVAEIDEVTEVVTIDVQTEIGTVSNGADRDPGRETEIDAMEIDLTIAHHAIVLVPEIEIDEEIHRVVEKDRAKKNQAKVHLELLIRNHPEKTSSCSRRAIKKVFSRIASLIPSAAFLFCAPLI